MTSWLVRKPVWVSLLLLVLVVPWFFVHLPHSWRSPLLLAVWDLCHILFFFCVVYAVQWRYKLVSARSWFLVAALAFAVGGSIEMIQGMTGRNASWGDVARNMTGVWLGLAWGVAQAQWLRWHRVLSAVALAVLFVPFINLAVDRVKSFNEFPVLANFERPVGVDYWRGDVSIATVPGRDNANGHALKVELNTARYSGFYFEHFPADWRGYKRLHFDLFNPGEKSLTMVLRVHDVWHQQSGQAYGDRYNVRFQAEPGWNSYQFALDDLLNAPTKRDMDLSRIQTLGIFTMNLPQPVTLYFDNFRLEP